MKTTIQSLTQNLSKGKIDPVYFVSGDEDFLIERTTKQIVTHAVEPGNEDFNLDVLYGNETNGATLVNLAMSYPMMAERRVVMVRNIHLLSAQSLELLAKYLQKPSPTTCLIMTASKVDFRKKIYATIRENSTHVEIKQLYDNKIPDWIRSYLAENKLAISDEALVLIHAGVGNSLRRIASEIDKIKLNMGDKKRIQVDDVEAVVGASRQFNVFEFCDAVGSKNIEKGLKILDGMLQFGGVPTGMLVMLNRHFTILAKLKELKTKNYRRDQIARELKINPFFIENYARQAGLYSRSHFNSIFELLLDADYRLKTSYQKPKMIMEMLLLKLNEVK
ncbi:MAG: DNA polymerase III subunit delta [Actinobacteria bacterium]|nr:DNA polymerase III subunit delta [Actinomycetota bacterium]